ncbi:glycosyltransferase [Paenibacillus sp. 5J-6]|uniref:Glycosyltransferase n=1 Tax=Paenibacillus silvestris TaxID=2606219 RepID=A0A6L8UZA7_9BACL|nr:glycosyltransferase [Paenibacillus silvestris]MZQ82772.1 glycosyltransferase [Paenibacillus silvestris]
MKGKLIKLTLLSLSIAFSTVPLRADAYSGDRPAAAKQMMYTQSMVQLKSDLRRLWMDHAIWTRNYVVSALAGLENKDKTLARLLRNQKDIGNAMKPFYGEDAGNKLGELLTEHIVIAGKIVDAAKSGNAAELDKNNKDWYRNADDIATFLNKANPNWTKPMIQDLMYVHLQMLTEDVKAMLAKDWDADIMWFDKGADHLMMMSDALTEGIIKQFPQKFK